MCFPRVPFGGSTTTRLAFFLLIFQSNLPTLALGAKQRRRRPFFLDDPDLERALVESQTRTTKVFVSSSLQNKKAKRVEKDEYQGSLLCTPPLSFFVVLLSCLLFRPLLLALTDRPLLPISRTSNARINFLESLFYPIL